MNTSEQEPQPSPIRRAVETDVNALYDLIERGVEEGSLLSRSREEIRRLIGNFFVYEIAGFIVGCVGLDVYTPKIAELRSLYVAGGNRGHGIATQLVNQCLLEARQKGIREVITISDKEDVFRKSGFSDQVGKQKALFIRI